MKFAVECRGNVSWELRYSVAIVGRSLPVVTVRGVLDDTPLDEMVEECRLLALSRGQGVAQMAVLVFGENPPVLEAATRLHLPVFGTEDDLKAWAQQVFDGVWSLSRLAAWAEAEGPMKNGVPKHPIGEENNEDPTSR